MQLIVWMGSTHSFLQASGSVWTLLQIYCKFKQNLMMNVYTQCPGSVSTEVSTLIQKRKCSGKYNL